MPWRDILSYLRRTANLIVGVPDYDTYVAHRRQSYPDKPVMSRAKFYKNRAENRLEGSGEGVSRRC